MYSANTLELHATVITIAAYKMYVVKKVYQDQE